LVYFFYRGFKLISFDIHLAHNLGLPVTLLRLLLIFITVSTIAVGIQMVGVILMAALMITPASGARFITKKIHVILILSGFFAAFSGVVGVVLSSQISGLPTGPSIVIILTLISVLAIFFGKEKGIWVRYQLQRKNNSKIRRENILKLLYKLTLEGTQPVTLDIFNERKNQSSNIDGWSKEIKKLQKSQLLTIVNKEIVLTDKGNLAAKEIVRKHRLWELYLSTYFPLKDDHLHDDAEGIEHVITPEIESHLMALLDRPEYDPHQSKIPY
jgi:manganese/zinc/iron transport system permease protein